MRSLLVLSLSLASFSLLCSCGGGRRSPGRGDGGVDSSGPCTTGQVQCRGREVWICSGSDYAQSETCADDEVCALGLGCRACQPGRPFCSGQEARLCDETGSASTLTMECPASQACRGGSCIDACAAAASERSNVGCEYYAVDLDNEYDDGLGNPSGAQAQFAVVLANPSDVIVLARVLQSVGTVGAPAETQVGTWTINPHDLVRIDLDAREVDGSVGHSFEGPGTFVSPNAYRITTNFPVVAYQFNPIIQQFSNDASLLIPVPALDTHYRVIGWGTANPISVPGLPRVPGIPDHSFVTIVGTQAATEVRVTLGGAIVASGPLGGPPEVPATSAGGVITYTLGPYDVLNLESDGIPGDLTGTLVESTAPVAVFSGGERGIAPFDVDNTPAPPTGIPSDICCTEHLEEQVFPTSSWGKIFSITRSPVRTDITGWREPDIYRVMADKNGTDVVTSLPAPNDRFTLNSNEVKEFAVSDPFTIYSSHPISVMQMLVSQGWVDSWKPGHGGDPSMLLFPPIEQYRKDYLFLVPDTFTANYVVYSGPKGTAVTLDGTDLAGDEFMRICEYEDIGSFDGIVYEQVTCPVDGGTHRIISTTPVGIMVYGYYSVGSYGYAGGSNLTRINIL
ncbi:MAG: hypothetical protein GXP55_17170 [Deltaproteobacteria bacterium]|nr:hypothetical protein [Deltaproteobacteria bacterium]